MKRNVIIIITAAVILLDVGWWFIGTGFMTRHDVYLTDFSLSPDGQSMKLTVSTAGSMGFIRKYRDSGGGVKPHYLTFYMAFGGLNGVWGAQNKFILPIIDEDEEIYFSRPDGGYQLVLYKSAETGSWQKP